VGHKRLQRTEKVKSWQQCDKKVTGGCVIAEMKKVTARQERVTVPSL